MFNAQRISLQLSEGKGATVFNYEPYREDVWRSGGVAPRILNLGTVVGIVTALWARRSGVRISEGAKGFSLLRIVQTGPGVHPASCSVYAWVLCRVQSGRSVKWTTYIHLKPKLRLRGAIPVLPLYAVMVKSGTAFMYVEICVTFTPRLFYPMEIDSQGRVGIRACLDTLEKRKTTVPLSLVCNRRSHYTY